MLLRVILFIILIYLSITLSPWLFFVAAALYGLLYTSYESVVLAACLDAYFGAGAQLWPYYTMVISVIVLMAEWLRPQLAWHE